MGSKRPNGGATTSGRIDTEMIDGVEHTLDGHHIVVGGRTWRAGDPSIPPRLRAELVAELMAARRAVGVARRSDDDAAVASARTRVGDAKVSLGERGRPWWDVPDDDADLVRAQTAIRTLLRHRAEESSVCPSEVARIVRFQQWRDTMPLVRRAATELRDRGEIFVTRGDETIESFEGGPVRLRRGPAFA